MTLLRIALILPVMLLAACSSSGPDGAKQVAELCDRLQAPNCAGKQACGCSFAGRPVDTASCMAVRTKECRDLFAKEVVADLDAGRRRIHAPAVERCVAAVQRQANACTGEVQKTPLTDCTDVLVDAAKVGEECRVTASGFLLCADGGGVCVSSGGGPRTCTQLPGAGSACAAGACARGLACIEGSCAPLGAEGSACTTDLGCGTGLACDTSGACAKPGPVGSACERLQQCAAGLRCEAGACVAGAGKGALCRTWGECGSDFACMSSPADRTCGAPGKAGESCEESGECERGLSCIQGLCAVPPGGEGDPCESSATCASGFTCGDGDKLCHRLPGEGEACMVGDRFCAEGLGCNESTQTCQKGGGDGTACLLNPPDYVCAPGFGCDFGANGSICRPLGGNGTKCETDRTCSADTYCARGTCRPRVGSGFPCPDGNECAQGLFCDLTASPWTCKPIPKRGEPCLQACEEGLACRGDGGRCAPTFCAVR